MLGVAGEATDALVDAGGSTIVAAADVHRRGRSVALVAERLALILAHADVAAAFNDRRHGQVCDADVLARSTIEEGE